MRCMKKGLERNKVLQGILCAGMLAISLYEVQISPSFTAMFLVLNFALCLFGVLLRCVGMRMEKGKRFFQCAEEILFLTGMLFSFPAVYIYAVGDDLLDLWVKLTFVIGTALELISLGTAKRKGKRRGIFRECVLWISFLGACFALLCAISSPMLFPYGTALLLLTVLKGFEKGEVSGGKKITWRKRWGKGAAVALVLASLAILLENPYRVAQAFSVLGKGPDFLYENSDKEMNKYSGKFLPGARWVDTDGNLIQAHGGQIQRTPVPDSTGKKTEKYVWIGENKSSGHFGNSFSVYSSEDLYSWDWEGDVLRSVESMEQLKTDPYFTEIYGDYTEEQLENVFQCINQNTVMERPKMLYNAKTGKYVLWFHSDDSTEKNTYKYDVGMAGVAISDSPFGPFRFLGRYRLSRCPEDQMDCFPSSKGEARDLNLFQEDDGTAYVVYEVGALDYVLKPLRYEAFATKLNRIVKASDARRRRQSGILAWK